MAYPSAYLDDPREGELADQVWQKAAGLIGTDWPLAVTHEALKNSWLPWINRQIIYARDWITHYRELDSIGGVRSVNIELGGSDYTAAEIAAVEHFYVSALMSSLGGVAGGMVLHLAGSGLWEMVIGPARTSIAWMKKHGVPTSWSQLTERERVVWRNVQHNWGQLWGPDWRGHLFGSMYTYAQLADRLEGDPEASPAPQQPPAGPGLKTVTVQSGDWLSKIAGRLWGKDYGYSVAVHFWPLLWDANRTTIGGNPNKLRSGMRLVVPEIGRLTPTQIQELKKRSLNWRSYS